MRRIPALALVVLAIVALESIAPISAAGGGAASVDVDGAWDQTVIRVLDATHTYMGTVEEAVADWQAGFALAGVPIVLEFSRLSPVCALCPHERAAPDVIVYETGVPIQGLCAGCMLPTNNDGGKYDGPMLVLVPSLSGGVGMTPMDEDDLYNYALHEFGHSLGFFHASLFGDAMSPIKPNVRNCVSNLDVEALSQMYAFLPGPWVSPPESVEVDDWACAV